MFDYVAGIADWKAAGLPVDGKAPSVQRVAEATRSDVPTCQLEETMADVRERVFAAGWDECVLIDCDGTVAGRLRDSAWEQDEAATVEDIMESGPTTVRPDGLLQSLVDRMAKRDTKMVLVTAPQGALIGALLRLEAERLLAGEPPEEVWRHCDGCPGRWAIQTQPV